MARTISHPIPDSFPVGTTFWEADGMPYAQVPRMGWFKGCGRELRSCQGEPAYVLRFGGEVDEDAFRRLVLVALDLGDG